jgi:aminomethyltransferase
LNANAVLTVAVRNRLLGREVRTYNPVSSLRLTPRKILGGIVPVGTAFHERTLALCESLNYREWSGYYTVSVYEMHHEHEYNAIRNSAALIDISPLFKYHITGIDATRFVNRVISRDINKVAIDQVIYCCWCDPEGKVIDDGTITRLGENEYRWTAADPSLRWFQQNALALEVKIEDISEQVAALALQGPTSGKLLHAVTDASVANLKYFRVTRGQIAGVPVDISRTGYTGDLGFEIWMPWKNAGKVWDELVKKGKAFDIHPAGMIALDIARIEAGLILIEVDYTSSKKALIESQKFSPSEIGLEKLVDLKKDNFVGRDALVREKKKGGAERTLVGLEINWNEVEALYDKMGMAPQVQSVASRVAVPVYRAGKQVGKATSTTWSPTLKKMIALACVNRDQSSVGATVNIEMTVEAVRHTVSAKVVALPFFNPARKAAVPVI